MSLQKFRMTSLFWSFHRFVPETTLGHRDTGTLGHQDTLTEGNFDTGTLWHRDTGTLGHQDTLTQGNFDTGTLWHRDTFGHRDSLTPGQFDTGTVWHRDTLTQGHFDTGALWHRDALTPEHFDLAKTILIWSTYELRFGIIEYCSLLSVVTIFLPTIPLSYPEQNSTCLFIWQPVTKDLKLFTPNHRTASSTLILCQLINYQYTRKGSPPHCTDVGQYKQNSVID